MSSKLIPANPAEVMVIRDLTPNITILSVPFLRYGTFEVGGRCTIVRMSSGGVTVFSPVALTSEAAAVVKRLGGDAGVKYLVAPDVEHHLFLSEWLAAYPSARIIGPEGLPERRAATEGKEPKVRVDDPFFAVLNDKKELPAALPQPQDGPAHTHTVAPDFDADFALVYFDTAPNKEIVALYRPDRVMIEADLLFNLPATEQYARVDPKLRKGGTEHPNLVHSIFQAVMGTSGEAMAARRAQWYVFTRRDRPRFSAHIALVDSWDFDTIIPCHGDVIQGDGKAVFRKMFGWHLQTV